MGAKRNAFGSRNELPGQSTEPQEAPSIAHNSDNQYTDGALTLCQACAKHLVISVSLDLPQPWEWVLRLKNGWGCLQPLSFPLTPLAMCSSFPSSRGTMGHFFPLPCTWVFPLTL